MNTSRKSTHRNRSSFYYITSNTLFFFIRNTSRELTQTKKLDWSVGVVTSTTKYYKQAHLHCTIAHKTFREHHSYVHRVRNVYIVFSINQVFDKKTLMQQISNPFITLCFENYINLFFIGPLSN